MFATNSRLQDYSLADIVNLVKAASLAENVNASIDELQFRRLIARHSTPDYRYAKYFKKRTWLRAKMMRALETGIDKTPPGAVLDLGCGPGYFLYVCRYFGHAVHGIDLPDDPFFNDMVSFFGIARTDLEILPWEILPPAPAERRRHLGSGIVEDEHRFRIGGARRAKRNIDISRTERAQPYAVAQSAGLAMIGPDWLVDHVPGMHTPGIAADKTFDMVDENALRVRGRRRGGEPGGVRFLPGEPVAAQREPMRGGEPRKVVGAAVIIGRSIGPDDRPFHLEIGNDQRGFARVDRRHGGIGVEDPRHGGGAEQNVARLRNRSQLGRCGRAVDQPDGAASRCGAQNRSTRRNFEQYAPRRRADARGRHDFPIIVPGEPRMTTPVIHRAHIEPEDVIVVPRFYALHRYLLRESQRNATAIKAYD